MARHEADREDLMKEATALRVRIELEVSGEAERIVAGFRHNGGCSIYFGPDPVFHFDADGGLRRAFVAKDLYRSQRTTLARLTRTRTTRDVHLVRHDLDPAELARFLAEMRDHLDRLRNALLCGSTRTRQQVPAEQDLRPRLLAALSDARRGQLSEAIRKR